MKLTTKSVALALALPILSMVGSSTQSQSAKVSPPRLTLEASADIHSATRAVVLKWSLKNNSDKEISVPDVNLFLDHKFVVKDQNNRTVSLTERGQQAATASYFAFHRRTTVLPSGGLVSKELQISDFFDMRANGVYTITIERRVPRADGKGSEMIRSNSVKVRIGG